MTPMLQVSPLSPERVCASWESGTFMAVLGGHFRTARRLRLSLVAQNEIDHRLRIFGRKRKMSFAFPDDTCDLPAEFLITLLDNASLLIEPGVKAATIVQDRDAGFRQRTQVIDRRRLCHETAQSRIADINAGDFVRV